MMKRKIIIAVGVALLLGTLPTWAQPKARAAQEEDKSANDFLFVLRRDILIRKRFHRTWYGRVRFIVHWI